MKNFISKILIGAFLIFVGAAATAAAKNPATAINYEVEPSLGNDAAEIKIRFSFRGGESGTTKIRLPLEFAGQSELYRAVKNLRLLTSDTRLIDTDKPEIKIVEHAHGAMIRLEYELIQDWTGTPQAGGASQNAGGGYRPVLQPDYFHFLGSGGWITPDLPDDSKLKVSIKWTNISPNFTIANSFGANEKKQKFSTDVASLASSVFVGGDFRIVRRTVKGKSVFAAMRGKWNFTNEEFAALVEKIVHAEREFWRDFNRPYFLVTLLPIESDPRSRSIGGTGLTDSFATFVTTNATLTDLAPLIAHEYFHNWNTNSFGGMKQPEQLVYWFSEGFTDYYTYRLLLRAGLIDLEKYAAQYNEFLSDYYLSPVRSESNQRVLHEFFSDYAVSKLPYRRGMLLATKWNEVIRRQSNGAKSLDNAMRQILRDAQTGKIKEISTDYVVSVLSNYAKYDFAGDVERYVERGETVDDFGGVLGECVDAIEIQSGRFELGFDFETTRKNKIVAQVIKDSAAYAAGVRDGQKLVGLSFMFGDVAKPVEIEIEENGQSRKITYLPETIEKISIPQFKIKSNLAAEEKSRCLNAPGIF